MACNSLFQDKNVMETPHNLTPLSKVMNNLKSQGYASDFIFRDNKFRDMESGKEYDASEIIIVEDYRFEGISNPDDMSILYAVKTADGTKGTISAPYGASYDGELNEFISRAKWEA
jgi:hypothetical protein